MVLKYHDLAVAQTIFNRELARLVHIYLTCNFFYCNVDSMCLHFTGILLWDVGFFFQRVFGCWEVFLVDWMLARSLSRCIIAMSTDFLNTFAYFLD